MSAARQEAVRRLQQRRRPEVVKTWTYPDGRVQEYAERDGGPEFFPAENLADWADDLMIVYGQPRGPFSGITADLLANAREPSPGRAVDAILSRARKLDEISQVFLMHELAQIRMQVPVSLRDARDYMQQVVRAAEDTGLTTRAPEPPEGRDRALEMGMTA